MNSIYGSGMYLYAGVNCNGIYRRGANIITTINNTSENIISYKLFQNYPNPFNPNTIIRFQIKDSRLVTLKVYDILGKEVATLVNEKQSPGVYEVTFDGSQFPSGIYFYKLETDSYRETKRMLMIK
ncbi:MAG: T9SS type A sorting domain-containing protein [Ignavibacteriae bacterium]|nr:T9SS type A sorting domain-containing protein [Ignavibacteriota bacterium]